MAAPTRISYPTEVVEGGECIPESVPPFMWLPASAAVLWAETPSGSAGLTVGQGRGQDISCEACEASSLAHPRPGWAVAAEQHALGADLTNGFRLESSMPW